MVSTMAMAHSLGHRVTVTKACFNPISDMDKESSTKATFCMKVRLWMTFGTEKAPWCSEMITSTPGPFAVICSMANGLEYEGWFVRNEMEGEGRLQFPDGAEYKGSFKLGQREGQGEFRGPDGLSYVGTCRGTSFMEMARLFTPTTTRIPKVGTRASNLGERGLLIGMGLASRIRRATSIAADGRGVVRGFASPTYLYSCVESKV